jgi:hypothetical protein
MSKLTLKRLGGVLAVAGTSLLPSLAFAVEDIASVGEIAKNLTSDFGAVPDVVTGLSYIFGLGLMGASVFGLKKAKDSPDQNPISRPLAGLGIGAFLTFLPAIVPAVGESVFGGEVNMTDQVGNSDGYDPFTGEEYEGRSNYGIQ